MLFSKKRTFGMTLLEVLVSTASFTVVLMTLFTVVKVGTNAWKQVESKSAMQTMLRKVETYMLDDIRRTSLSRIYVGKVNDLTVVWFPSALGFDDTSFDSQPVFSRTQAGEPLWKRTILYYVTPLDATWHTTRYGFNCSNKFMCPHKMLIRKEIVFFDTTAAPGSSLYKDMTLEDITPYVKEPSSYDFKDEIQDRENLTTIGCKKIVCLSDCMQSFDVHLPLRPGIDAAYDYNKTYTYIDPNSVRRSESCGVDICIRAFNFDEASRHIDVTKINEGTYEYSKNTSVPYNSNNRFEILGGRFTMQYDLRVVPNN